MEMGMGMKPLPLQVVKKSCYPRWNEIFEFELAEPAGEKLCVEVWDWDLVGKNDFLGKVSPEPVPTAHPATGTHPCPVCVLRAVGVAAAGGVWGAGAGGGWAGRGLVQAAAGRVQGEGGRVSAGTGVLG